jgi:hypothetical protein
MLLVAVEGSGLIFGTGKDGKVGSLLESLGRVTVHSDNLRPGQPGLAY